MKVLENEDMKNIDMIFAETLERTIQDNLGPVVSSKIKERLFEKFGISITKAIWEFEKIDYVLREFFGAGAEGIEKNFFSKICYIKSKKDKAEKIFTISDLDIGKSILKAFSDEEMSKILNASVGEPWTISEILEKLEIPKTSGYRKINFLIEKGLLIRTGYELTENRRKVEKYKSLFDNVNINIGNKFTVSVQFTQEAFRKSTILQTVYNT